MTDSELHEEPADNFSSPLDRIYEAFEAKIDGLAILSERSKQEVKKLVRSSGFSDEVVMNVLREEAKDAH